MRRLYKRAKKNTYTGKKDNLVNLERVTIEHRLNRNDLTCKECGEQLVEIGVKSRKEIIKYVPAKLIVEEHIIYSYACKSCERETGESYIISAPAPQTIFYYSVASNELIAHTIILKYHHAMPLYRQESCFDMMGVALSRQTLCNWAMSAAEALAPIIDNFIEYVEREIKPFVIGRKNFLFANTAKSTTSSANIYSIVETAKANKLVVERYLVYLFDNLSKIDTSDSGSLENLMPWFNKIPENMKIKDRK